MNKKILFIAWDAGHVTYMETLFLPIFQYLKDQYDYNIVILHYSWSSEEKVNHLKKICTKQEIEYIHKRVLITPVLGIGKLFTLLNGIFFLFSFLKKRNFDIVMPRSTMPALLCCPSVFLKRKWNLVFDADGLPIEERVDFAGLKKNSFRHKILKVIERNILKRADLIITRSVHASEYLSSVHKIKLSKFLRVINGRDSIIFSREALPTINQLKMELKIPLKAKTLVYCGSLGPQYGIKEMLYIHEQLNTKYSDVYLLILANNPEFLAETILDSKVVIRKVDPLEVPKYLSVGDVAFAIREQTFSMCGVAPIKLGEYLLMGLPVLASARIGDSDNFLSNDESVFFLESHSIYELERGMKWIGDIFEKGCDRNEICNLGKQHFSIEAAGQSYHNALSQL